jgi:hypothetical protein
VGIQEAKARQLILGYGVKRMQTVIAHTRQQTAHNPTGFIIRALEQDWQIMNNCGNQITDELEDGMRYVRERFTDFIDY